MTKRQIKRQKDKIRRRKSSHQVDNLKTRNNIAKELGISVQELDRLLTLEDGELSPTIGYKVLI